MRPSCGMRRSAMSRSERIFTREATAATRLSGMIAASRSTPSMRYRTRMSPSCGSKWMSETPRSTASVMMRCTSWMTEASSPAEPKSIGRSCSRMSYIGPPPPAVAAEGSGTSTSSSSSRSSSTAAYSGSSRRSSSHSMSGARGDRRPHLVAGHDRDVVDREHVRGVGHRDQQRAFGDERHGHGLVALDGGRGDELGRVGVDLVVAQRDVVEPEALRDRAGELVVGDRALRRAGCAPPPIRPSGPSRWRRP